MISVFPIVTGNYSMVLKSLKTLRKRFKNANHYADRVMHIQPR